MGCKVSRILDRGIGLPFGGVLRDHEYLRWLDDVGGRQCDRGLAKGGKRQQRNKFHIPRAAIAITPSDLCGRCKSPNFA